MYLGSLTLFAHGLRQINFRSVLFCSVLVSILFRLLFQRSNFHNSIISIIQIVNVKCHISWSCCFGNPVSAYTIFFIPIFTSIISQKKKKRSCFKANGHTNGESYSLYFHSISRILSQLGSSLETNSFL